MLLPCEVAIKFFIPAVRASVAKKLSKNYNMSQITIASMLGITQATVSNYLTGKYSEKIKKLEKEKSIELISKTVINSILKKKTTSIKFSEELCKCCKDFIGEVSCEISIRRK